MLTENLFCCIAVSNLTLVVNIEYSTLPGFVIILRFHRIRQVTLQLIRQTVFLPRDGMRKRGLYYRGVGPSVRPSRSSIVSRRLNISSNFFFGSAAPSF